MQTLWIASALLGLGYGGMFGLFPTIMIEYFGLGEQDLNAERGELTESRSLFSELGISMHVGDHRKQLVQPGVWTKPRRTLETDRRREDATRRDPGHDAPMSRGAAMLYRQRQVDDCCVRDCAWAEHIRCAARSTEARRSRECGSRGNVG